MNVIPVAATAIDRGLARCHDCGWLTQLPDHEPTGHVNCPRCCASIHLRAPDSLSRTWALILAAVLLYIPANVLPIMTVVRFGQGDPHTILGGVQELVHGGQWPLAALVFFASIVVPMLKLVGLSYLAISVQWRSKWRARDRTRLYRIVESVGRWSMIDIFVISILVALVQLGAVATIAPGAGASFFAAVVVITMVAAEGFDQRLIWDVAGTERTCSSNNTRNRHEA